MLKWLEQLSDANQHTIAALGAISTLAAVVGLFGPGLNCATL